MHIKASNSIFRYLNKRLFFFTLLALVEIIVPPIILYIEVKSRNFSNPFMVGIFCVMIYLIIALPLAIRLVKSELKESQKIITKLSISEGILNATTTKLVFFRNGLVSRIELEHKNLNSYLDVRSIISKENDGDYEFFDTYSNFIYYKLPTKHYHDPELLGAMINGYWKNNINFR